MKNSQNKCEMSVNPDVGKISYKRRYSQVKKAREEMENFTKGFHWINVLSQA